LQKGELGLIEVKDFYAYAAVKRHKVKHLVKKLNGGKIKKRKLRIELSR
jgi:ATP-independent RNA helicase DbpA